MNRKWLHTVRLVTCLAVVVLAGFACSGRAKYTETIQTTETLGRHYREHHDYYSLTRLLPHLELRRRRRAEIESLLGPPAYSPMPNLSYYPTDRSAAIACPDGSVPGEESCVTKDSRQVDPERSFPVILIVQYLESASQPHPEDRLDSISLGPVGE